MKIRDMEPIKKILTGLSKGFRSDERETSILVDYYQGVVYLETTEPFTARKWFEILKDDPKALFDVHADSLKIRVPIKYCRKPEFFLKPKYRKVMLG